MSERYADQGLVIIGVHSQKGGENMASVAESSAIPYPLAIDSQGATVRAYGADSFPDYYLIDR
ncbi:MAG: redoxin domain-containing protein, partial [Planctomycetes bacterium]|nr:redoxin domain-containing protein [Planctomycetota bacterium]